MSDIAKMDDIDAMSIESTTTTLTNNERLKLPRITFQTDPTAQSPLYDSYTVHKTPLKSGAFGKVYRVFRRDGAMNEVPLVAKIVPNVVELKFACYHVTRSFYREYLALELLNTQKHQNTIELIEVFVDLHCNAIFIFKQHQTNLMDLLHNTFNKLLNGKQRSESVTLSSTRWERKPLKLLMWQLASALRHCHGLGIMHQDVKPSNVLIDYCWHKDPIPQVTLTDFGISTLLYESLPKTRDGVIVSNKSTVNNDGCDIPDKTQFDVCTLWWRAPEILLGSIRFGFEVDVWALACVFWEILSYHPLFTGQHQIEMLFDIYQLMGTPTEQTWPGVSKLPGYNKSVPMYSQQTRTFDTQLQQILDDTFCSLLTNDDKAQLRDLLSKMLSVNPATRLTMTEVCQHAFFVDICTADIEGYILPSIAELCSPKIIGHNCMVILYPPISTNIPLIYKARYDELVKWTKLQIYILHFTPSFSMHIPELCIQTQNCAYSIIAAFLAVHCDNLTDDRYKWVASCSVLKDYIDMETSGEYFWPLLGITAIWIAAHKIYYRSLPKNYRHSQYRDYKDDPFIEDIDEVLALRMGKYITVFNMDDQVKKLHPNNPGINRAHIHNMELLILQTVPVEYLLSL
jgi:serine/threonine protein kinase